jgi:hypothetical protein
VATPQYDPKELLLPALLAMDVYHRGPIGGLTNVLKGKETSIDGVTPFDADERPDIGFYARAYTVGDTIYISYRGTDDGSLVLTPTGNLSSLPRTLAPVRWEPLSLLRTCITAIPQPPARFRAFRTWPPIYPFRLTGKRTISTELR